MQKLRTALCWICGAVVNADKAVHIQTFDLPGCNINRYECDKCAKDKSLQRGIGIGRADATGMWENGWFKNLSAKKGQGRMNIAYFESKTYEQKMDFIKWVVDAETINSVNKEILKAMVTFLYQLVVAKKEGKHDEH